MILGQSNIVPGRDWAIVHAGPDVPREHTYRVAGLDLGQTQDRAAVCVLERRICDEGFIGPRDQRVKMLTIHRYAPGTDYADVAAHVLAAPIDVLVVEFNGVGRPVVDMMRKMIRSGEVPFKGRLIPVTSLNSRARMHATMEERGKTWSVPKIDLVSSLMLLVQSKILTIPRNVAGIEDFMNEVRIFQMRYTKAANLQFGNEPGAGKNDDTVIAAALSAWWIAGSGKREAAVWVP